MEKKKPQIGLFCLASLYFFAAIPTPAAMSNITPPSIGQLGLSGGQFGSGCACEMMEVIVKRKSMNNCLILIIPPLLVCNKDTIVLI